MAKTKRESGYDFPASAYAYVPDATQPSTWKLRLWETPEKKETARQVGLAVAALGPGFRGRKVSIPEDDLAAVKAKVRAAWKRANPDADPDEDMPAVLSEALPGERSVNELRKALEEALLAKLGGAKEDRWLWVMDFTDEWVVYELSGSGWAKHGSFRATYSADEAGKITVGASGPVEARTTYTPAAESAPTPTRVEGRVLESKGDDDAGGRVFRVQVVAFGDSKNRKRYPKSVMSKATRLYEGAKAYDHHRSDEELSSSTIAGLVGSYRAVEATDVGLEADLHLLPSASHTAEALDASLAAQADDLPPLVGVSHDVLARFRPVTTTGRRVLEATEIVSVNSADIVADPAAGGRPLRMVAGGAGDIDDDNPQEGPPMTLEELLELINGATPEQITALVDGLGVSPTSTDAGAGGGGGGGGAVDKDKDKEPEPVGAASEAGRFERNSGMGRLLIRTAVEDAKLDERLVESVTRQLPERFSEADLTRTVETARTLTSELEKAGLGPTIQAKPEGDEVDRKAKALAAMFEGNFREGYASIKTAYRDITGVDHRALDDAELPFAVIRESFQVSRYEGQRSTESVDSTTWGEMLGDAINKRMVAQYRLPGLDAWQKLVSSVVPRNDFRTVHVTRMGGYGLLPTVAQGAPYQPLPSPPDEEATYAPSKRGGTEDLTIETIANDDIGAVRRIPDALGRSAALTLYRFVVDFLPTNPAIYDGVALFAAGHANTDAGAALAQGTLSAGRRKMRKQAAYGGAVEVLGIVPRYLWVPSDLEELAWQLATSAVAIPAGSAASNIPNIHQGLEPVVVDYWADTNDWFLSADPATCPTIEMGFFGGRTDPELFVQDDPRVGAVFSADKITYKIRHIYGGSVLDYRGLYRAQG